MLLVPFTAFLAAEELHASGILAVVAAAFSISVNLTLDPKHQYPGAYRTRLQEEPVWPVLDFLLETFVFAYIGLQLKFVLEELAESAEPGLVRTLVAAGVLLVVAIVVRLVVVFGLFGRWTLRDRMIKRRAERDVYYRAAPRSGSSAGAGAAASRSPRRRSGRRCWSAGSACAASSPWRRRRRSPSSPGPASRSRAGTRSRRSR